MELRAALAGVALVVAWGLVAGAVLGCVPRGFNAPRVSVLAATVSLAAVVARAAVGRGGPGPARTLAEAVAWKAVLVSTGVVVWVLGQPPDTWGATVAALAPGAWADPGAASTAKARLGAALLAPGPALALAAILVAALVTGHLAVDAALAVPGLPGGIGTFARPPPVFGSGPVDPSGQKAAPGFARLVAAALGAAANLEAFNSGVQVVAVCLPATLKTDAVVLGVAGFAGAVVIHVLTAWVLPVKRQLA
jgi:hypothetical protein